MGAKFNEHFTRVDTLELRDVIYNRIGHQRADKYFNNLNRFLNLKLSKCDFDKCCIETIGRENISLHNRLIRSIVQNASHAKTPPQNPRKIGVKFPNSYKKNCMQSPLSRKLRDRPSPLGPFGKSPSTLTVEETFSRIDEEGEEEVNGVSNVIRWSSIEAPFGVLNKPRKSVSFYGSCRHRGELPETETLRGVLEKNLESEGIGISSEEDNRALYWYCRIKKCQCWEAI
ncbi:hypothetical protein MIMGU_mgv1a013208mg [Erythranthe guttata]|uniref:Uncharacterized protein n=1 Tax=Erythranthe guttata TaxID=4155 RepID=A0A022RRT1_ERYGU|nr:hypothetical protein MIMGU_mgv1a013208mg [Erythranthe guttata]